ncbi:bifunctional 2-C-methyl-D-erythritol 4-phosphate cytidylyltransferase/2-C-methyl-D-erythritol 2,4-cyclodiphosphate synthase [Rhizobium sp. LjRoot254]|uniref:bifunctional 2-C-methyl-D-erythritol 4-phosphate cytidylyltransferase/2-C-methyl-D-erythritol 2,4-cyclodiphosphate synthase n=1 Tax=Rhizobium sp. LjRoot254 TaxID=3342297 RepID=UPI003ECD108B
MTLPDAPRFGILIVAAGRGERAGVHPDGPKQYRLIGGVPVITHSVKKFAAWKHTARIVIAIHADDEDLYASCKTTFPEGPAIETVLGGATRQASVLNGLEALESSGITHVMIHDAVRPFFTSGMLNAILAAHVEGEKAVLPVCPVADTLKRATEDFYIEGTVSRTGLYAAQTPQSFDYPMILAGHRAAAAVGLTDFTDDAAIAEWQDIRVKLVEGDRENIKLTLERDIELADEKLMRNHLPDVRTGNGYDVHQLEPGDGVILCGVKIPHDQRLRGHSDADVALHALTDALLATCGAGDIGDHFPPSDPQWKGAASRIFLEHAAKIVRDHGGTIMNADVSIIAEAPKIGPHRESMRNMLAEMLDIELERCSVKATTNEKIGFVGRGEGIAAIATATVVYGRKPQ